MADFLTNLAARSMGQSNSIRPRRETRFEPAIDVVDDLHEVDVERMQQAPTRQPVPRQKHDRKLDDTGDISDNTEYPDAEQPSTPERPIPQPVDRPTPEPSPLDRAIHSEPAQQEPVDNAEKGERRTPGEHEPPIGETIYQRSEPRTIARPVERTETTARVAPESTESVAPATRPERGTVHPANDEHSDPRVETHPLETTAEPHIISVRKRVIEDSQQDRRARTTSEPSETTTDVSVTIGRVEVKSTPTPQPQRPEPRPRPRPLVSLDEYLSRSQRGRR